MYKEITLRKDIRTSYTEGKLHASTVRNHFSHIYFYNAKIHHCSAITQNQLNLCRYYRETVEKALN